MYRIPVAATAHLVQKAANTRYEIRDVSNLRNLAVYLLTNAAKLTSITKLKNSFTISQ